MKFYIFLILLLAGFFAQAQNADVLLKFKGGKTETKTIALQKLDGDTWRLFIPRAEIPADATLIEITPDFARAKVGDDGYFILPNGVMTKFGERKDGRIVAAKAQMAFVGSKTPSGTYAAIVKGMPFSFSAKNEKKGDAYRQSIYFDFAKGKAYNDILIDYVRLDGDDANYSGMAKAYRQYKLDKGDVKTIREKIKYRPALEYCLTAPEIRIRQGWKPAPPKVLHQNLDNEPPMKVVVTFDRVGDIVRELKKQGVDKAELCLVGWNIRGHDGRYPQMFPVEPALGGESKLRQLIKNTLADGFQITCHTNSTDAYEIADVWSEEFIIKNPDGSLQKNQTPWSGGQMFNVCWKRAYEKFGANDLRKVADLGFKGMHYIDVVSCVAAPFCSDPRHAVNPDESAFYMNKIFEYCNETFGGSMSEGGYDHCFKYVDSVLYVSFLLGQENRPMIDRQVPIWPLVYHGIILYNPGPYTINHPIKDAKAQLKFVEFGGRPSFYFHSKFRDSKNWMGEDDITCETDEKLAEGVSKIREAYDQYRELSYLQLEFMEFHDEIAPNVFLTRYSDGSEIVSNYSDKPFAYKNSSVKPLGYRLFKPSLIRRLGNAL